MSNRCIPALAVNRNGELWTPGGLVGNLKDEQTIEFMNSLGSDQTITTLTQILPKIIEQKFYEIKLSDYFSVAVGQGNPFSEELFNWKTGITGDDFESGLVNTVNAQADKYADDITVEPFRTKTFTWIKDVAWNIIQEKVFSQGTQNLSYVQAKYSARKKQYDLGIQRTGIVGLKSHQADAPGLLTQSGNPVNTSLITKPISTMTTAELDAFVATIIGEYVDAVNYTAIPDTLVMPAKDFYGMTSATTSQFPIKSKLTYLRESFSEAVGKEFKILPLAWAQQDRNAGIANLNKNRYVLYNNSPDTLEMQIPLDFTLTTPGTANNFDYSSVAYSRFTGLRVFRPLEVQYFDYADD